MDTSKFKSHYSRNGLWRLFVATAFPLHLWAIILILMDISWVAERTNFWDAIGVAAYGLFFILIESIMIWGIVVIVGYLLPKNWSEIKRVVLLGTLVVVTAIWAILGQLAFLLDWSFPHQIIMFLANQAHPLRILYMGFFLIVGTSVMVLSWLSIRSEKYQQYFIGALDRVSVLVGLYLFLDGISIVIVIIRNLG